MLDLLTIESQHRQEKADLPLGNVGIEHACEGLKHLARIAQHCPRKAVELSMQGSCFAILTA